METPQHFTPEKPHSDHFTVDDLLNLPSDDPFDAAAASTDSSAITATATVDSCNSSAGVARRSLTDTTQFSHDLCVPYDDMAELEWLSNFVEESFSSEDMEKLQLLSGVKSRPVEESETHPFDHDIANRTGNSMFNTDKTVPAKARTKRSRAAPSNWTSRLIGLSQTSMGPAATLSSESETDITSSLAGKKTVKTIPKKKEVFDKNESRSGEGRKCYHCATDKTPQWRTGPLGPKTLCNACGVRYKSGRLVPEYRPAASPTFVLTKHSNSHRKVLELRRQKEMQSAHQQPFLYHQNMMFDVPKGDEYLIHQHVGLDYRQLI